MSTDNTINSPKSKVELDAYRPSIRSLSISKNFSGEKLSHDKSNWQQWNRQFLITLALNSLKGYVKGTVNKPDKNAEPRAHANWLKNDELALHLTLENINEHEQEYVADATTSKGCWDLLEERHSKEGPMRQLQIIQEAMSTRFSSTESFTVAGTKQCKLAKRVIAMGELTYNVMASLFLLAGITPFPHLRTTVNHNISNSTKETPYTAAQILRLLENEQRLLDADKPSTSSTSIALVAKTNH
jgi:hypothetical protein